MVYLSLIPIMFGVCIATMTEISFEIIGMLSALFATATFSIQNIYSKLALKEVRLNPIQLLMKISQTALIICIPLWLFIDTPTIATDDRLANFEDQIDFLFRLLVSGLINWLQNILAFSILNLLSPLSYSVANATKRILVIVSSVLTLKNPVTMTNFFGMMLAVLGVFLYNRAKIFQNSKKNLLPKTTKDVAAGGGEEEQYVSTRYRVFHRMNGI